MFERQEAPRLQTPPLQTLRDGLAGWVAALEPGLHTGADARTLLDLVGDVKRLAGAAELLLARRVAETGAWDDGGPDRTAAHWLARRSGTTVGEARAKLKTAERLDDLPDTQAALRSGKLSDQQARAAGAVADPLAEGALLATAEKESLRELRNESRRAQAVGDEEARQREIHRRRTLQVGVDSGGTFRLTLRTTAAAGSTIVDALRPFTEAAFRRAREEDRRERPDAYAADALVDLARAARTGGGAPKSNVKAILVVDVAALRRGSVEHGEVCEIRGVGPVPVSTARELLGDAALAVVVKDGVDVRNVAHFKRRTTAHQRTVLELWGIRCSIVGCDSTDWVDVHHTYEWALSHRTRLDELEVNCRHHHRRRHRGWQPSPDELRRPLAA